MIDTLLYDFKYSFFINNYIVSSNYFYFISILFCNIICYITYDMDFRFVPSDPECFDKLSRYD